MEAEDRLDFPVHALRADGRDVCARGEARGRAVVALEPSAKCFLTLGALVREPRWRRRDAAAPRLGSEARAEALLRAAETDVERIAAERPEQRFRHIAGRLVDAARFEIAQTRARSIDPKPRAR